MRNTLEERRARPLQRFFQHFTRPIKFRRRQWRKAKFMCILKDTFPYNYVNNPSWEIEILNVLRRTITNSANYDRSLLPSPLSEYRGYSLVRSKKGVVLALPKEDKPVKSR